MEHDKAWLARQTLSLSPRWLSLPQQLELILFNVLFANEHLISFWLGASNRASSFSKGFFISRWFASLNGRFLAIFRTFDWISKRWRGHPDLELEILWRKEVIHSAHMLLLDIVTMHRLCLVHLSFHILASCLKRRNLWSRCCCKFLTIVTTCGSSWVHSGCEWVDPTLICRLWKLGLVERALVLNLISFRLS